MSGSDTARLLAEITDAASFERIAAAVLRSSDASLYVGLAHPGVQPGGKTVKAPFDNIGWARSDGDKRFVCAAHTTEQGDLRGKWLHDPSTVTPRGAHGKPTQPAGDLVKGIAHIRKLQEEHPGLEVTFALTTNREPSLEVVSQSQLLADDAGIQIDIWSVSRIAHFLDTEPAGQVIRRNHLGTPIKLLSKPLLLELGKHSLRDHHPSGTGHAVPRDDFKLDLIDTLVVGDSGMGKTTACVMALEQMLEQGQAVLLLRAETVAAALTIEDAIDAELRRQQPELDAGAGGKALLLCSEDEPLMILIEDVNRSTSPALVLNKVIAWMRTLGGSNDSRRTWRGICPIWPRQIDAIQDQKRVLASLRVLQVGRYTEREATQALLRRAATEGVGIDQHRGASIAARLGRDPLLIDLHDLSSDDVAEDVIQSYLDERIRIAAVEAGRPRTEVWNALHGLLRHMLQARVLDPDWAMVLSWISDQEVLGLLKALAKEGSVIRLSSDSAERVQFRHDRVMNVLFSRVFAEDLQGDPVPDYVVDPFFAEVLGVAAARTNLALERLLALLDSSPVAAAHALRHASGNRIGYVTVAAQALRAWIQLEHVRTGAYASRRHAVAVVLSETTDPVVVPIVADFPPADHRWFALLAAAFRNGLFRAGMQIFTMYELGLSFGGKHSLLALVRQEYGEQLIAAVDLTLRSPAANQGLVNGALNLAGYVGNAGLGLAIQVCWSNDEHRHSRLKSYLFAAARCCGDAPEPILGPVCDAWENLPEESDSSLGQPIDRLAADGVSWELRDYPPLDALAYLVSRARRGERLAWPITYMLRSVDHPDAVEQIARFAAARGIWGGQALNSDWERFDREGGRRMSAQSKGRLWDLARDEGQDEALRKAAFKLWETSRNEGDLEITRSIQANSPLYDKSLWARARRHDRSVIPEVIKKIEGNPTFWLQVGRYFWSEYLTASLEPLLDQLAESQDRSSDLEYAVANALLHVEQRRAVAMLAVRWAKLMAKPQIVQFMLLAPGAQAASLAKEAIAASENPGTLLERFVFHALTDRGSPRMLQAEAQLQRIVPYLDLLSENDLEHLWTTCGKCGWTTFSAQFLDPRLRKVDQRHVHLSGDPVDTQELDSVLSGGLAHHHRWLEHKLLRGIPRDEAFAALLKWLASHDETRAFEIARDVMSTSANRREFQRFHDAQVGRLNTEAVLAATQFDVFSRSIA